MDCELEDWYCLSGLWLYLIPALTHCPVSKKREELGTGCLCALLLASSKALWVLAVMPGKTLEFRAALGKLRVGFQVCGKSPEAGIFVVGRALCYTVFENPFADCSMRA